MSKGFTLIESLVVISILSIFITFSTPSIAYFIQKQQVAADIITITGLINSAKSKAIQLNQKISVCGLSTTLECQRNWQNLHVLVNDKNDSIYQAKLSAKYKHTLWSSFQRKSKLVFNSRGYTDHLNGSLYLCHQNYPSLNRVLRISKSGRISTSAKAEHLQDRCN